MCYRLLVLFLLLAPAAARGQGTPEASEDLKPAWQIYENGNFAPFDDQPVHAIYFSLGAPAATGKKLVIKLAASFQVFINGKLAAAANGGTLNLDADSLLLRYPPTLNAAVHFRGAAFPQTFLILKNPAHSDLLPEARKANSFLSFAILAVLVLFGFFVFLFRSNPKLTLDYLNVAKLISIQEREENLTATRITSSVNLLVYLYVSACFALALLVVFYYSAGEIPVARYFQVHSAAGGFYQWLRLIVITAGFLTVKLIVIYCFARLFHLRETTALQFFNFVRMLFLITGIIAATAVASFMFNGYLAGPHIGLLKMALLLLGFSVVMVFLKLMSFASFSFFHLFSYLCASEIIPLVILLRVLLY